MWTMILINVWKLFQLLQTVLTSQMIDIFRGEIRESVISTLDIWY